MTRTTPEQTKLLICIVHPYRQWCAPPSYHERAKKRWPAMRVVNLQTYAAVESEIRDADIFAGASLRPQQFVAARKLKWIQTPSAGVNQLMYPELRSSGVIVTNARGVHSQAMSEHVLGTIIALARNFPAAVRCQAQHKWAQKELGDEPHMPRELGGQLVVLIGFGGIGRAVARLATAMGMRVWAVTRSGAAEGAAVERVFPRARLEEALAAADFAVLAAPDTPETRHMIGARQFAAMKPTAFLINVARGSLVDEAALLAALGRGQIAGAALDVTEPEPLPPESPLWDCENLFITPHLSAGSDRLWEREGDLLLENLERWFSGRDLLNPVDLARGY
ncbi:MAG TPA: D-2-hydroxyacid dehydrogenase [Candidatus Acidoferrales bacterium]|nr:D-2-hydroxyacid dehydrogenase [Candidatus Acidoferrales bacterium]